ncbi:hypothetical protein Tco_1420319 [Tanacetum coccineum]
MAPEKYNIPTNLHPRLPPPRLTMDKLPSRRVVPDAMPERHSDTDIRDDFLNNYNEEHAERLATPVVPLRPPPRHLLYLYGLTTACRHPKLRYVIKDIDG